jgi:hypothetical protein
MKVLEPTIQRKLIGQLRNKTIEIFLRKYKNNRASDEEQIGT